jgi:DNA-binding IclR family transcriptional regulator
MAVKTIRSVENAFRVLELLAERQPVGVSALARELTMDKNAVQRVLVTLGHVGWIRQSGDDGAWVLTHRATRVAHRASRGLRDIARPHLDSLQHDTGETALLWQLEGDRLVAIDSADSAHPLRMTVPAGTEVPLSASHDLLTFVNRRDRDRSYYLVDDVYPNAVAVGAALLDEYGRTVGALTVVGPRIRLPRAELARIGGLVGPAAAAISASLAATR